MNIFDWVRQHADGELEPLETFIVALRNTDPGTPIWRTQGGAIDETTMIGHAISRWFGNDPMRSIAKVSSIEERINRVPRMFTRPICVQTVRGEQVSWMVIQDDTP